jgi:hypothetical protein
LDEKAMENRREYRERGEKTKRDAMTQFDDDDVTRVVKLPGYSSVFVGHS